MSPGTRPGQVLESGWGIRGARSAPLGSGHINDTLLVTGGSISPVVLQRINERVFTDPERVMRNLARVQAHLRDRAPDLTPALIETLDGQNCFRDRQGGWWRLWNYLPDSRTIEQTRDPAVCRAAARTFGRFQRLLGDLPGPPLEPVIPGFLQLAGYLERFDAVVAATPGAEGAIMDACGGAGHIDAHRTLVAELREGDTVIHGDCKLNNLLFEADAARVRAVLDLDTVMIGHWAWDFGDLARSVLSGALDEGGGRGQREESDGIALALFTALVEGFQSGSERCLDARALAVAPVYVAFMLAIRFLTDHLDGDRYFKVSRRGENLDRARRQFDLIERLPISEFETVASTVVQARTL